MTMRLRRIIPAVVLVGHLFLALRLNCASAGIWPCDPNDNPMVYAYARLVGLTCTYGFFAPRVASPCYLEIGLESPTGTDTVTVPVHALSGNEGRLRYRSLSTLFLDMAPQSGRETVAADTAFNKRIARAFARSIAEREARQAGRRLAYLRVVVYRHPELDRFAENPEPRLITLYEYEYPAPR